MAEMFLHTHKARQKGVLFFPAFPKQGVSSAARILEKAQLLFEFVARN